MAIASTREGERFITLIRVATPSQAAATARAVPPAPIIRTSPLASAEFAMSACVKPDISVDVALIHHLFSQVYLHFEFVLQSH